MVASAHGLAIPRVSHMVNKTVRLGSCALDVGQQRLFGPDGPIDLRPKTFAVLCYLAANPGRVIGKVELLKAVWPDVTVTDDAITHCISEVRRAMGADNQKLIQTVPRRGYLLAIKAGSIVGPADPHRGWSRWDRMENGKRDLLRFIQSHHLAVLATNSSSGQPLASVVSFVVTDHLEIIVDTNRATGKSMNIRCNPKVALAIGWENRQTLEVNGSGEVLAGAELTEARKFYAGIYPERARQLEAIITEFDCIRIRLSWIRFSDFQRNPASIYTLDLVTGSETREVRLTSAERG